jgi:UDP-perosamine 4-acetyltransferase
MKKIIIIGGGGHAKVVADIFISQRKFEITGYIDNHISESDRLIHNIPYLGNDSDLEKLRRLTNFVFVAIGDCNLRNKIFNNLLQRNFSFVNAISPFANLSSTVKMGVGIAIMPGVSINADTTIEDNVIINTGSTVDHDNFIKTSAHIAPGCSLAGSVTIGACTFVGVGCKIVPGVTVGNNSIIGAGSVVVKSLPSSILAYGVPAKVRSFNENNNE